MNHDNQVLAVNWQQMSAAIYSAYAKVCEEAALDSSTREMVDGLIEAYDGREKPLEWLQNVSYLQVENTEHGDAPWQPLLDMLAPDPQNRRILEETIKTATIFARDFRANCNNLWLAVDSASQGFSEQQKKDPDGIKGILQRIYESYDGVVAPVEHIQTIRDDPRGIEAFTDGPYLKSIMDNKLNEVIEQLIRRENAHTDSPPDKVVSFIEKAPQYVNPNNKDHLRQAIYTAARSYTTQVEEQFTDIDAGIDVELKNILVRYDGKDNLQTFLQEQIGHYAQLAGDLEAGIDYHLAHTILPRAQGILNRSLGEASRPR